MVHSRVWHEWQHPRDNLGEFANKRTGWLGRVAQATRRGPFTDAELAGREQEVNAAFTAAHPHSTHRTHRTGGRWSDERARIHRQIVDEIWDRHQHVPTDRQAILTGGLAGAGKTTVLEGHAGVDTSRYLTVSADEMKDELTRRGLTPTVPDWEHLSPMEHSTLIHMETIHMADMLGERAYVAGKNVIYDSSMGGREGPASRLERMREHGYTTRGIFVDIPVETSVQRATSRYRHGQREWLAGRGPGGRPIPPEFILAQRGSGGQTVNRGVFEGLVREGLFDRWDVYDNSGTAPVLIANSKQTGA